jgi:glyoxylase I family protein
VAYSYAMTDALIVQPLGIAHVRLTVTDIARSRSFYVAAFGADPVMDYSEQSDDPSVRADPARLFGGCMFALGDQILGLRPAASTGDTFSSARVGLDHISLRVPALDDLHTAAERLTSAGIEHGEVNELSAFGLAILSFQDPDDINLELTAAL